MTFEPELEELLERVVCGDLPADDRNVVEACARRPDFAAELRTALATVRGLTTLGAERAETLAAATRRDPFEAEVDVLGTIRGLARRDVPMPRPKAPRTWLLVAAAAGLLFGGTFAVWSARTPPQETPRFLGRGLVIHDPAGIGGGELDLTWSSEANAVTRWTLALFDPASPAVALREERLEEARYRLPADLRASLPARVLVRVRGFGIAGDVRSSGEREVKLRD